MVFHFNLDEIEERDWDDVITYGLAQAWCLSWIGGINSISVAITWIVGVWLSNCVPDKYKLDWKYVEIIQGFTIGLVCIL